MERTDLCLEIVQNKLKECNGVITCKLLKADEKKLIQQIETQIEEKIAYYMCRTLNEGVREALQRDYTIAVVLDTSIFEYPHHPFMKMVFNDTVVGEQISDLDKIIEYKKDKKNFFFLWENFVIYTSKLPRERGGREKLRLVYVKRRAQQLEGIPCVERGVFGTLSFEGDAIIKDILSCSSPDSFIGTCLIGFNIKR